MTNSVMPTANSVLYSIEPVGTSPLAVAAMKAVSVSIDLPHVGAPLRLKPACDHHDHRLADRARHRQHDRGDDPGQRRGEDHPQRHLDLRGA